MLQGMVGPVADQQLQFLQTIRFNVERMAVLVSDLSDISRIETGRLRIEPTSLDLNVVLQEALMSFRSQIDSKGQTLAVRLSPNLPKVHADRARLIQILTNLISNAHKYSPQGGTLTLTAEATHSTVPPTARTGTLPKPVVRLNVSDTGYGISPEDQSKLFSQFFRSDDPNIREQTGWGLGLHITKRIVELMGGEMSVKSEQGKGSTFSFTVPIELQV
jgi:signal transduction histidine kinase